MYLRLLPGVKVRVTSRGLGPNHGEVRQAQRRLAMHTREGDDPGTDFETARTHAQQVRQQVDPAEERPADLAIRRVLAESGLVMRGRTGETAGEREKTPMEPRWSSMSPASRLADHRRQRLQRSSNAAIWRHLGKRPDT